MNEDRPQSYLASLIHLQIIVTKYKINISKTEQVYSETSPAGFAALKVSI